MIGSRKLTHETGPTAIRPRALREDRRSAGRDVKSLMNWWWVRQEIESRQIVDQSSLERFDQAKRPRDFAHKRLSLGGSWVCRDSRRERESEWESERERTKSSKISKNRIYPLQVCFAFRVFLLTVRLKFCWCLGIWSRQWNIHGKCQPALLWSWSRIT